MILNHPIHLNPIRPLKAPNELKRPQLARSLKSVLVFLAQILDPFGPPKKFLHVQKKSKVRTLYFDLQLLNHNRPLCFIQ